MAELSSTPLDIPSKFNLINLPPEVRLQIYDHCFPPAGARIQLLPFWAHFPECHLNLPSSLYLVCKAIYAELPLLSSKLRSLDNLYIIEGDCLFDVPARDDDPHLRRFQTIVKFAERMRLVGEHHYHTSAATLRLLLPGRNCAIKMLEVEPLTWSWEILQRVIHSCLLTLLAHPDVTRRLEISVIRTRDYKEDLYSGIGKEHRVEIENRIEYELGRLQGWLNVERKKFKRNPRYISPWGWEVMRRWKV